MLQNSSSLSLYSRLIGMHTINACLALLPQPQSQQRPNSDKIGLGKLFINTKVNTFPEMSGYIYFLNLFS